MVLPAIRLLEKNVAPHERVGQWSLKARDLMDQADTRLTPRARQAWRWRILLLRARIDAQLYLNRGARQGRVLHDAFEELTRIYHAQNAEPAVKPPPADPTEPPVAVRPADFRGPQLAEAYGRAVLSSKPMAYWRMGEVAGDVLKDSSGNARSAEYDSGVELFPPVGPKPANPAAVFRGGRISATIDNLPDAYSVELWVWNDLPPTARAITAYFFSRGMDGPQGTVGGDNLGIGGMHRAETQGKLFFFNGTRFNHVLSGTTALKPRRWYHMVVVRQGRGTCVYLDGGPNPEICGQAEIGYPAGCGQLFFGGRNDGFAPLEGKLADVSVYNRAEPQRDCRALCGGAGIEVIEVGGCETIPQELRTIAATTEHPFSNQAGLHGQMAVDGILDVDAAAPAGEGRRLGQRGEGLFDGAQPAIAAGPVEG